MLKKTVFRSKKNGLFYNSVLTKQQNCANFIQRLLSSRNMIKNQLKPGLLP